jgi:hypothetical protein
VSQLPRVTCCGVLPCQGTPPYLIWINGLGQGDHGVGLCDDRLGTQAALRQLHSLNVHVVRCVWLFIRNWRN